MAIAELSLGQLKLGLLDFCVRRGFERSWSLDLSRDQQRDRPSQSRGNRHLLCLSHAGLFTPRPLAGERASSSSPGQHLPTRCNLLCWLLCGQLGLRARLTNWLMIMIIINVISPSPAASTSRNGFAMRLQFRLRDLPKLRFVPSNTDTFCCCCCCCNNLRSRKPNESVWRQGASHEHTSAFVSWLTSPLFPLLFYRGRSRNDSGLSGARWPSIHSIQESSNKQRPTRGLSSSQLSSAAFGSAA